MFSPRHTVINECPVFRFQGNSKTHLFDPRFTQTKSIAVLLVTVIQVKQLPLTVARPCTSLFLLKRCPYGMNDLYVYVFPITQISYMKPCSHRYLQFRIYVSIIKKFSNGIQKRKKVNVKYQHGSAEECASKYKRAPKVR
jgi:hypothetical protein